MQTVRLPEYCVDRQQAHDAFHDVRPGGILRIDFRDTLFTGRSFTDELAKCIQHTQPETLEVIGGGESIWNLFEHCVKQSFTIIPT